MNNKSVIKRGRPKSKVTRVEYFRKAWFKSFTRNLELVEQFQKENGEYPFVKDANELNRCIDIGYKYGIESSKVAFLGVLEMILKNNMSIKKDIDHWLNLMEIFKDDSLIVQEVKNKLKVFPNDILRQYRKPIFSKKIVLSFTRVVKNVTGLPYLKQIAIILNKSEEITKQIAIEAIRQKKIKSIERDKKGNEFILINE